MVEYNFVPPVELFTGFIVLIWLEIGIVQSRDNPTLLRGIPIHVLRLIIDNNYGIRTLKASQKNLLSVLIGK